MKKIIYLFLLLVFILTACASDNSHIPSNWKYEFEQNRAKWEGLQITHYRISLELPFSACDMNSRTPFTIEVMDDNVVSVVDAKGEKISPAIDECTAYYYPDVFTIPGLFSYAYKHFQERPPSMRVSYDQIFGYPETIYIIRFKEPCCEDYTFEVRDFEILP